MNVIASTDLWFPGSLDGTIGVPSGWHTWVTRPAPDPTRYVVWVDPGRGNDEQAPRTALHVQAIP